MSNDTDEIEWDDDEDIRNGFPIGVFAVLFYGACLLAYIVYRLLEQK